MMFVEIRNRSGHLKLINVDEIGSITSGDGYTIIFARSDGKWEDYAHDYDWWKNLLVKENNCDNPELLKPQND